MFIILSFITVFMDVATVMHHILCLICIAYLTQIHIVLDCVVDPADPLLIGLLDSDPKF